MEEKSLSARQTQILKAIIDEYIDTAEPIGSLALEKKYDLGVSPATIRNEMASLTLSGFLRQPHTSAGRVPTPLAMKFYINQLMEEKEISLTDEVKSKEDVKQAQNDLDKVLEYATRALAEQTGSLAIAATKNGGSWSHGLANIFDSPELSNHQVCQSIFSILDQRQRLEELFFERLTGVSPIEVLFGEEIGWEFFEPVGVVATQFELGGNKGAIGIIGPYRLNYSTVIPMVRHFGNIINEYATKEEAQTEEAQE